MSDRGTRVAITVISICALLAANTHAQQAPTTMWADKRAGLSAAQLERMEPPKTFYARVVDPNGKPVASARVLALSYEYSLTESGELITILSTDADGRFQLTARDVRAFVQAPGFGLTPASIFRETGRDDPYLVTLRPATEMHVHFVDADGKPAAGAKAVPQTLSMRTADVSMSMSIPDAVGLQLAQTTDAAGEAVFLGMPQDANVGVTVIDDRYAKASISVDGVKLGTSPLSDGGVIKLEPGASIAGKVTIEETGKPVPGLRLFARSISNGRLRGSADATTDADGNYNLSQLPPGDYDVNLESNATLSAQYAVINTTRITLTSGQHLFGKDFTFINGGIIQGKVTVTGTGKPVPNASVFASSAAAGNMPRGNGQATAEPDGSYSLHILPGQVRISVSSASANAGLLPPSSREVNVQDGNTATVDFAFRVDPTPAVNGRVVDSDGKPVADANILIEVPRNNNNTAYLVASSRPESYKSDADGKFTLLGIANGTVLRARKGDAGTTKATTINANNRDVTLTLKDDAAGSVLLHLAAPDGSPIPGARITIIQESTARNSISTGIEPGTTKTDGKRLIKSLFPDYTYSYQISAKGYGRETGSLQPQSGKQIDLPIKLVKADSFVAGMVTDDTGMPATDQEVEVSGQKAQARMIKTDIMGHFRAENVVPGDTVIVYPIIHTQVDGRTLSQMGQRQTVAAGTDNVVLVNTPPPPPTTRPGVRRGP